VVSDPSAFPQPLAQIRHASAATFAHLGMSGG
jgi:hypothetical protein